MNIRILNNLSLLKIVLSKKYIQYLTPIAQSCSNEKHQSLINIYAAYCYVIGKDKYSALDIFNDSELFNKHFQQLIGFIYESDGVTIKHKYALCNLFKRIFSYIADEQQLSLEQLKLSNIKITNDVAKCIFQFQQHPIDSNKLNYINGWQVVSKQGKTLEVFLDEFYVNFGMKFTEKVHKALINYAFKHKSSSLENALNIFKSLFGGMVDVYVRRKDIPIEVLLSRNYVQPFFHKVFKVLFARSQAAQNCPKYFHKMWAKAVFNYTDCFINTDVFGEPHKPFIVPNWKTPKGNAPTFSIGGNAKLTEKVSWFSNIPLKIKDEDAISIIQQRLERDISYIKYVCVTKFNELTEREARNNEFIEKGLVKPLSSNSHNRKYHNIVGPENLANTVATFNSHGIANKSSYSSFLGFAGKAQDLNRELNLPNKSTLNVLLTLLVIEHPLITPSWLDKWELFDVHGNQIGFNKSGGHYIAVSYKSRKGAVNAQQVVILNNFSASIVKFLIQHTRVAREYLKQQGDRNWRMMILTATSTSATRLINLNASLHSASNFYQWLQDTSLIEANGTVTVKEAKLISDVHSLRSVRRHRGLQIYLESRSMDVVSEALGHEKKDTKLLTSYLPKPLMDFFNDRWVRQFQSAILLEAMKGSVYCLDAVNMTTEDIQTFLANHGIKSFPECFAHGLNKGGIFKDSQNLVFSQLTYTISTSLLQVLFAIRDIVENCESEQPFLDIVTHWYQSAVFIINTLNSGKHSSDSDLMDMLQKARRNQLNTDLIKGALLC